MTTTTKTRPEKKRPKEKRSGADPRVEDGEIVRKSKKGMKGKKDKKRKEKKSAKKKYTAKTADRHELYQHAVQSPEEDVLFLERVYKTLRKKKARHFREDFCGTGLLTSTWIQRHKNNTAEGFDLDPEVLAWGVERNFEPLGDVASRAKLHLKDVREPSSTAPDIRAAQNFSYYIFKTRKELLEYCTRAYEDLADDGVFVMDIYGGPEAMEELEEVRKIDEGFTYVWDQDEYWPATGEFNAYIHFRFRDGTEMKKAFSYPWRLWFLTEVMDVLRDAGFQGVETYWEGTDKNGVDGNGVYKRSKRGENCLSWVTYLVALK